MFRLKLFSTASTAFNNMGTASPRDVKNYEKVKKYFHSRFHGAETKKGFKKIFDDCNQRPSETVQDYAARLETSFNYAYPADNEQSEGKPRDETNDPKRQICFGT